MISGHLYLVCFFLCSKMSSAAAMRVAIVGGGISGTSTAYFLSQLLSTDIHIDLYEGGDIGGRLATVNVDGFEYETGGTIIHQKNQYASQLSDILGLTKISEDSGILGLYDKDKKDFIFTGSHYKIISMLKLFWRYGLNIYYLDRYIEDMLSRFDNIYKLQENNKSFSRLDDLLEAMDPYFPSYLNISTYEGFKSFGLSEKLIDELVQATIKCNYGQTTSIHQFVGSVSVAGAGYDLFSIKYGNKLLPTKLLDVSNAKHIKYYVENISLLNDGKFQLNTHYGSNEYDVVVISTPLTSDTIIRHNIEFLGFPVKISVPGKYWKTVCTIIKGEINPNYFGFTSKNDVPDIVISINNSSLFNSIGKIVPVTGKIVGDEMEVWKIFSVKVLTTEEVNELFNKITFLKVIDWLAYPEYGNSGSSYNFTLYDNLFYSNAMEWSASAIETGIISGRNVALLIHSLGKHSPVESDKQTTQVHDEM